MTEVAQTYIGNINNDSDLKQLVATESCLEVTLQPSDRHKGRIHAHTASGIAVGIIKSRDRPIQSGDLFRTNSDKLLLVNLEEKELLVLDLSSVDSNLAPAKLVQLGHTLGNHHYPIMMQGSKIYVQLVTDKLIVEKLINDLNIAGLQIKYQTQSEFQQLTFSKHIH